MDFFTQIVFEYNSNEITIMQLILGIVSIIASLGLLFLNSKILRRVNIKQNLGQNNIKMLRRFIRTGIVFLGVFALLESFDISFSSFLGEKIIKTERFSFHIYHIVIFYAVLIGTKVLLAIAESIISNKEQASQIEQGKTKSIYQIIRYFIYLIAIAAFIQSLGINITILIASLSALLLGLGLGIQHLFNDIVSGLIVLFDRSIKVGDVVEIKDELIGQVVSINLRTSVLVTRDDIEVIIPNSKFTSDNVINWTHNAIQTRFFIKVGVAYGSDVRLVEKILLEVAANHKDIAKIPEPKVHFIDFGESSLDFKVLFYSEVTFRIETTKSDLRFEIDKKFRENGVTIPFPQRDVHIKQA